MKQLDDFNLKMGAHVVLHITQRDAETVRYLLQDRFSHLMNRSLYAGKLEKELLHGECGRLMNLINRLAAI